MNQNYYLSRLFSEIEDENSNGYALSGEDGLAESTPEQDYLLEQEHLAEQDPEIDPETLVHSDFYGYQPVTYFYADDEEEDEPTEEEVIEETVKQAAWEAYLAEQTRIYNANATAQALADLGVDYRYFADAEDEDEVEDEEDEVETLKQALLEDYLQSRYYAEQEAWGMYSDYMTRLYAENEVAEDEEIIHVDEDGNEVAPEVVAQALLDDYAYSRFYAESEDEVEDEATETEEIADDVQDLHEDTEKEGVDVPQTATEELKEEATKKQASIYELEERVTALL